MALINCPECNKEISDKSAHCINCGAPKNVILESLKKASKSKMTLIKCTNCYKVISGKSTKCINCGVILNEVSDSENKKIVIEEESKNDLDKKSEIADLKHLEEYPINLEFVDIIFNSVGSFLFFILILTLQLMLGVVLSIGMYGVILDDFFSIWTIAMLLTTSVIVRKIYFSKFMKRLLAKRFIKNYFGLTGFLIAFVLWLIIIHLSFISVFDGIKNGLTEIEGFFMFVYLLSAFISANKTSLTIALVLSIIGKFGFKQNFNHLFGIQILIFNIINLIYLHFIFI